MSAWNAGTTDEEKRQGFFCPPPFSTFDECVSKFSAEADDPEAFCAAWKDECGIASTEEGEGRKARNIPMFLESVNAMMEAAGTWQASLAELADYLQLLIDAGVEVPEGEGDVDEEPPAEEEPGSAPSGEPGEAVATRKKKKKKKHVSKKYDAPMPEWAKKLETQLKSVVSAVEQLKGRRGGSTTPKQRRDPYKKLLEENMTQLERIRQAAEPGA